MKKSRNILIAFILNLFFSVFEFVGGIFTGSTAILSDSVHDLGDAVSIGISYALEKKSEKKPDENYTYGYLRYSVLGGLITTLVVLSGSAAVIHSAVQKIINPVDINYNGMIIFAVAGLAVNFAAVYFTHGGKSVNQRAVNLHMLEDVLGWAVVLVGAIIMRFTAIKIIDPVMSIAIAIFIIINSIKNIRQVLDIILEKKPQEIDTREITEHLKAIDGVTDVHHIHLRSLDGVNCCAEMHIVISGEPHEIKENVRNELKKHGIIHATLETENPDEHCHIKSCNIHNLQNNGSCHHTHNHCHGIQC